MPPHSSKGALDKERFDAVLFDLDGVLTNTARTREWVRPASTSA